MNPHLKALVGFALTTSLGTSVYALGFRNPDQNAAATAQGEAFVAQADNASALYYNPGGLTQIHDTEGCGGGYITSRDIQFHGSGGDESVTDPAYSMQMFGATTFGISNLVVGAGLYIPFGNDINWGNKGQFKYDVTKTGLTVQDYALGAAYQICDHFSFGAVFNFYNGSTYSDRLVPFSLLINPSLPDGKFHFEGTGQAFGATLGAMIKINDQNQIGIVYRSPFTIDFHGHAVVKNDPTGLYGSSPATAEIQFPQSVAVGYAYRPIPKLKLEADVEWTDWDTLNQVKLHSPNAAFANDPGSTIPFNWESSFFYEAGAQYQFNEMWAFRGGYIFSQNSVPNSTFSPADPDSNRHVFSLGVGWKWKHFGVDLTDQYSYSTERTINNPSNPTVNGKWSSQGNAVMLSSSLYF